MDSVRGADINSVRQFIEKHQTPASFGGKGFSLGGPSAGTGDSLREARLRSLGAPNNTTSTSTSSSAPKKSVSTSNETSSSSGTVFHSVPNVKSVETTTMDVDVDVDDDEATARAIALSMAMQSNSSNVASHTRETGTATDTTEGESEDDLVPIPVNEEHLASLIAMGFSSVRSRSALYYGKDNMDAAIEWLSDHEYDPNADQELLVKRCDANKKNQPPLTPQEIQEKVKLLQEKAKNLRLAREAKEKEESFKREIDRRERAHKMDAIMEERQKMARQHEIDKMKKEKEDQRRERERLREEIKRDKEIRKLNSGVLPSVLGVDGYNPTGVQYDASTGNGASSSNSSTMPSGSTSATRGAGAPAPAPAPLSSSEKALEMVDKSIQLIMKHRTSGDGGNALKLLITFVKNIVENPGEIKYRSINMETNAFKSKIVPVVGALNVLTSVGFAKDSENKRMTFDG